MDRNYRADRNGKATWRAPVNGAMRATFDDFRVEIHSNEEEGDED